MVVMYNSTKKTIVITGLILAFLFQVSRAGPRCFDCQRLPNVRDCDHVTTCGAHEVCHVKQVVSHSGNVYYDVGCIDKLRCVFKRSADVPAVLETESGDIQTCLSCCQGDYCNNQGCSSQPMEPLSSGSRGPICFTCPHGQTSPEQCDKLSVCGRDQFCSIHPVISFGGSQLSVSGCSSSCSFGGALIGKRDTCDGCCQGDFCNANCSSIHGHLNIHQSSTIPAPTRPKSTPSTTVRIVDTTTQSFTPTTTRPKSSQYYATLCTALGYTFLPMTYHCYKIYQQDKVTWSEARQRCNHDNGDLFILHNKQEETLFESLTENPTDAWDTKRYWVGASDLDREGQWTWIDNVPVASQYFFPTEPNNGRTDIAENCGALSYINRTFLLNDDVCSNTYHFICEINLKDPSSALSYEISYGCRNSHYTFDSKYGICYKIYDTKMTMHDASLKCQQEGSDLLQLRDRNVENLFLNSGEIDPQNHDKRYWLGATRSNQDGNFYWLNGHRLLIQDYLWPHGQPDNYNQQEECINLANVGIFALNDDNCNAVNDFICEEKCPNKAFTYLPSVNLCVKVFIQPLTWEQAQTECRRQHADLAEPDTVKKIQLLGWLLDNYNLVQYWVGARTGSNGDVYWNISQKPVLHELLVSYSQPHQAFSCANMHRNDTGFYYVLDTLSCDTHFGFICQHIW